MLAYFRFDEPVDSLEKSGNDLVGVSKGGSCVVAANNGQPQAQRPGVPKPPNPIENPSTKDKICFYATAATSLFTIATGPGALPATTVPSIITGGATTVGEVGGFVIEPEIAVPVLTVAVTGALLFCL